MLFDLGGVLLPFDPQRRVRAVCATLEIDDDAARAAMSAELFARLDLGEADEGAFAHAFSAAAGRVVDADEARALILSVFEPPDAALWDLAGALAKRLPVGGFSDNPAFVRDVFPAGADLDPMFWSAELGATKSSDAAFAAVEATLGAAPDAILFVDDSAGNVERARRRGWDAIRYCGIDRLTRDLAERGLG
jgi:HAD superfamily hydrolase (TIGR01509 family)